ncbi:MAG: hypothetical protein IPM25_17605 [Chloracidobacterium sp.]|nr:hypothetical protein [Chloracidobacterium sp.]
MSYSDVFALDKRRAFVVGTRGTILATTNGGRDWRPVKADVRDHLNGISFSGENFNFGWIVGTYGRVLSRPTAVRPGQRQSRAPRTTSKVSAYDESRVTAVGSAGTVLVTRDGGQEWISAKPCGNSTMSRAQFLGPDLIVAAGYTGCIVRSTDGGTTWKRVEHFSRADILSLTFADHRSGSMSDSNGMFWLTGDGGLTWVPFNIRTNPKLVSNFFIDRFTGWAVGPDGLVLRTDDGGYSWQRLTAGAREDVNDLVFFDNEYGVAVGSSGRIWITNDAGRAWLPVFSNTSAGLNAVHFINADKGWAVGDRGNGSCGRSTAAQAGALGSPASPTTCTAYILSTKGTALPSGPTARIIRTTTAGAYWGAGNIGRRQLARRC